MITPATIIGKIFRKKGFTLVEVILASTIFTMVSVIGVTVFINVSRIQRRVVLENAMYEDGRFMMERLAREIRQNAIDYEEYYNKLVEGGQYGEKHGCYATRFYNPGSHPLGLAADGPKKGGLGAYCSTGAPYTPQNTPGCVIDKRTLDINTGQNPYQGISLPTNAPGDANAMCDLKFPPMPPCTIDIDLYDRDQLYLIDSKGRQKTFIALKQVNKTPDDEFALAMVRIQGEDVNTDDIVEKWVEPDEPDMDYFCAPGYDCTPADTIFLNDQLEDSLDGTIPAKRYEGFVPMSPTRTNITSIHFYVSPVEDPRKAFAETDIMPPSPVIQQQPHVTVVMTLQPAANELVNFAGNTPTVTLQTTVSSEVYNEVRSYTGAGSCGSYI